jgi:hypothetical protein
MDENSHSQITFSESNLSTICESIVLKLWKPQRLTALWASAGYYRDMALPSFFFFFFTSTTIYLNSMELSPS